MTKPMVRYKKLREDAEIPIKKTEGAAAYDLYAHEDMRIAPTTTTTNAYQMPTGLSFEIPEGYHLKIYLRSSTGANSKIRLANGTGIIDADYRGEVMLLLENVGWDWAYITKGERIAQMILEENVMFDLEEVTEDLTRTRRNTKGIGSTGKK